MRHFFQALRLLQGSLLFSLTSSCQHASIPYGPDPASFALPPPAAAAASPAASGPEAGFDPSATAAAADLANSAFGALSHAPGEAAPSDAPASGELFAQRQGDATTSCEELVQLVIQDIHAQMKEGQTISVLAWWNDKSGQWEPSPTCRSELGLPNYGGGVLSYVPIRQSLTAAASVRDPRPTSLVPDDPQSNAAATLSGGGEGTDPALARARQSSHGQSTPPPSRSVAAPVQLSPEAQEEREDRQRSRDRRMMIAKRLAEAKAKAEQKKADAFKKQLILKRKKAAEAKKAAAAAAKVGKPAEAIEAKPNPNQ